MQVVAVPAAVVLLQQEDVSSRALRVARSASRATKTALRGALRRPGPASMPQAVSSLPSMAKPTGPGDALLAGLVVEVRLERRLRARRSRRWPSRTSRARAWSSPSAAAASTWNSVSAHVPLNERPGPPSGRFGSVSSSRRKAVMLVASTFAVILHLVLRRRVALREEASRPPAAGTAGRRWRCPRPSAGPPSIRARRPSRPPPTGPSARPNRAWRVLEALLDLADLPALLGQLHQLAGRVDRRCCLRGRCSGRRRAGSSPPARSGRTCGCGTGRTGWSGRGRPCRWRPCGRTSPPCGTARDRCRLPR